ncbi:MAG: membrane or secreted protein [Leadbetterella sp.]|nr:membrane or secreted protein [Leadbetterella sp.]
MKSLILSLFCLMAISSAGQTLAGGWKNSGADKTTLILATGNYISVTEYKPDTFLKTWGGKYEVQKGGSVHIHVEFNSADPSMVGTPQSYIFKAKKKGLEFNGVSFDRVDARAQNALTGLWVITGRANAQGEMGKITPGARRTYKMMADGHFQWLAINTQSGEFSGTGGGRYTLKDGKYTETIEFFSRDNSRVGAELQFDASVSGNEWIHSGKSSKGDPIKEIWTRQ